MEEKLLEKANELLIEKKFATAIELYEEYINQFEKENDVDLEVLKNLGLCYVNTENYSSALRVFKTVLQINSEDATSNFYVANIFEKLKQPDKAVKYYEKVISLRENYAEAYKNLALIHLKNQNPIEAKRIISQIYELTKEDNTDFKIPYIYGNIELYEKNFEDALKLYEIANELNPNYPQILNSIGCCYLALNNFDKAKEFYMKSLELDENNFTTQYNVGTYYLAKTDFSEAAKHFERAYALKACEPHLAQLAYCQLKLKQYEIAYNNYLNLTEMNKESFTYKFNMANCLFELGRYTECVALLTRLASLNPKSTTILHKLAKCFEQMKQYGNSGMFYEKLLKMGKVSSQIYSDYAMMLMKDNDKEKAENILKKLLKMSPEDANAHKDLGVVYLSQRLFDYAREEFELAYKYAPQDADIIFECANFYQATEDNQKAYELYEQAIEKDDSVYSYYDYAGINALCLNKIDKAKAYFEKSVSLRPNSFMALQNLGKIALFEKKYDLAKEILTEAYLISQDLETTNLLATAYMELDDLKSAEGLFLRLNNMMPDNCNILYSLAKCRLANDDVEKAKEYLNKILSIFPDYEDAKNLLEKFN